VALPYAQDPRGVDHAARKWIRARAPAGVAGPPAPLPVPENARRRRGVE
jgi:hypothetical protein